MIVYNGNNIKNGFIMYNGIYLENAEGGEDLLPHTEKTWQVFNEGLRIVPSVEECDYMDGIIVSEESNVAQWLQNGRETYYTL